MSQRTAASRPFGVQDDGEASRADASKRGSRGARKNSTRHDAARWRGVTTRRKAMQLYPPRVNTRRKAGRWTGDASRPDARRCSLDQDSERLDARRGCCPATWRHPTQGGAAAWRRGDTRRKAMQLHRPRVNTRRKPGRRTGDAETLDARRGSCQATRTDSTQGDAASTRTRKDSTHGGAACSRTRKESTHGGTAARRRVDTRRVASELPGGASAPDTSPTSCTATRRHPKGERLAP